MMCGLDQDCDECAGCGVMGSPKTNPDEPGITPEEKVARTQALATLKRIEQRGWWRGQLWLWGTVLFLVAFAAFVIWRVA